MSAEVTSVPTRLVGLKQQEEEKPGKLSRSESRNAQEGGAVQRRSDSRLLLRRRALRVGGATFPTGPASLPDRVFAWKLVKNL